MANRSYKSMLRDEAAAETRARIVLAAARLLRTPKGSAAITMDAGAKAARVTRLSGHNQFGNRGALFEAVFDARAVEGGLARRIPEAMRIADPDAALRQLVEVFCTFWASDPGLGGLHDAAAADPEFAAALTERNERRRRAFG